MKILLEKTDDEHSITMQQIISALSSYDIRAERKSLYDDMEALRLWGLDIIGEKNERTFFYHVGSRQFELPELKLLVDSVQSSKFITEKKSKELIKKIEGLASEHEGKQLHRQVYISDRLKAKNEGIYYNVDKIYTAIGKNVKIKFKYFHWTVKKEMEIRKGGEFYCISPWALTWDSENYYMVGFDTKENMIKHYRVDKMLSIQSSEEKRDGEEYFKQFNIALYTKKMFGMFDGDEIGVTLMFENRFAGVVIDRFGEEVSMIPKDEQHFTVKVEVAVSSQFLAWVIALGRGAKIIGPKCVIERMQQKILRLSQEYLEI